MKALVAILAVTLTSLFLPAAFGCSTQKDIDAARQELDRGIKEQADYVAVIQKLYKLRNEAWTPEDVEHYGRHHQPAIDDARRVLHARTDSHVNCANHQEAIHRQVERETALGRAAEREAARPQQEILDRLAAMEKQQREQAQTRALHEGSEEVRRNWKLDELADNQRRAQWQAEDRIRDLESKTRQLQMETDSLYRNTPRFRREFTY